MSSHGNPGHEGSLTSANSSGRARHHRQHSWPIANYVQKPTLALVSLVFFSMRQKYLTMFRIPLTQ
jgi:hypothetical protein